MSNFWKITNYGLALIALPLAVTAAASAHQRIANAIPIGLEVTPVVSKLSNIGVERCHTVALNRIGGVDGRVVSLASNQSDRGLPDLDIRFVKNGKIIRQGKTNSDGVFYINNVPEGVYSFIASGEDSFAAYQVTVVADAASVHSKVIELAAISRNKSLTEIFHSLDPKSGVLVANEFSEVVADGANRVTLVDGSLSGKILTSKKSLSAGLSVDIAQDGRLVASVTADSSGEYLIPGLVPGVYELVASSDACVAAVAFEVVGVEDATTDRSVVFVSTRGAAVPSYATSLLTAAVPRQDLLQEEVTEVVFNEEVGGRGINYSAESVTLGGAVGATAPVPETFVGGGGIFGGRVGGRVGGGVGGGGLGGLASIGGLAFGVVAVADDGEATPVSPVNP
jgi:hypothetical protein